MKAPIRSLSTSLVVSEHFSAVSVVLIILHIYYWNHDNHWSLYCCCCLLNFASIFWEYFVSIVKVVISYRYKCIRYNLKASMLWFLRLLYIPPFKKNDWLLLLRGKYHFIYLFHFLPNCARGILGNRPVHVTKFPCKNVAYFDGILPKGPTCHAYAWQIGPFWQDTLDLMKRLALY